MKRFIIIFSVCFALFLRLFTPVRLYFSGGLALSMFVPVICLFFFGGLYKNKKFYAACLVATIPLFLKSIGVGYFDGYLPNIISLLFAVSCMEYYIHKRDDVFAKYTLITVYCTIFFLAIISTPILFAMPGLNRAVMTMTVQGVKPPLLAYFTIEYGNVHAVPVLVIPLFLLLKRLAGLRKAILIIVLCSLYVTTVLSNASTPMFMLFMYLPILWLYNPKKSKSENFLKLGGIAILAFVVLGTGAIPAILRGIQPYLESTMQARRIDEVIYFLETGDTYGDIEERSDLYSSSWESFLSHPLTFEFDELKLGHHTFLLDHLAAMGIICFLPYAVLIINRFFRPYNNMRKSKAYFILSFSAFILLACVKNFFVCISAMFIVPTFILYIENKITKERI